MCGATVDHILVVVVVVVEVDCPAEEFGGGEDSIGDVRRVVIGCPCCF